MDVLGTPTAEQWPKMVSMPDYTHWLVLRRTDSYVVETVFSNTSASPLQCISGMWNAPVLRRGFICLSDCCSTILSNGSLRLMRFRIHGSMRTHCQSERKFKYCYLCALTKLACFLSSRLIRQLAWCRMIPSPKHPPRHEPGSHACKFHSTATCEEC